MGGRGNASAKNTGSSNSRLEEVKNDAKIKSIITEAKSFWDEADYYNPEDGYTKEESVRIGYTVDDDYTVYQTSDGKVYSDARVQRMVEGQDSGKYHAYNEAGVLLTTKSAKVAAKHAWGTPKQYGYKKVKK